MTKMQRKPQQLRAVRDDVIFIAPAVVFFVMIVAASFLLGIYYSFTSWNGVGKHAAWIGLENYRYLVTEDGRALRSAWFTIRFTITSVIVSNFIALLLALILTQPIRGAKAFRAIFFLPNVIGGIILGFVWRFIFDSAFSSLAETTSLAFFQLPWLGTPGTGYWAVVIVFVWKTTGYLMVIYIAAIVGIDTQLLEAARIDGAHAGQILTRIMIPLMTPAFTVCLFLMLSWSMKLFDVIFSLTKGGPFQSTEAFSLNIYLEAFSFNNYGYGSAKAVLFFIAVGVVTLIQVTATKRLEIEQ